MRQRNKGTEECITWLVMQQQQQQEQQQEVGE
jgi:hypothetical protein